MTLDRIIKKSYFILLGILILFLIQPHGGTWGYEYNLRWFYVFILGGALAYVLTPLLIHFGYKFNLLDHPNERKVHKIPVPRIGGIAIYTAFMIAIIRNLQFSKKFTGLIIGATIIFVLGLFDDIKPVSAKARIFFQLLASTVVIMHGVHTTIVPDTYSFHYLADVIITLFWFVGILNAVNFLDGIDGLVTSFGAVCSLLFFVIALQTGQRYLAWMCIALAGVCLGFLHYNWHKAKIFLGDSGATLIGFLLAGFAVFGSWTRDNRVVGFATPLLILSIPIFDMIYTTISRIRNGSVKSFKQWLEYVGKDHFHHRLLKLGLSVRQSVRFIILLNLCLGLSALIIRQTDTQGSFILLLQATVIFIIVVLLMLAGRTVTED
ncbi:MAG: hypothetical protein A3J83_01640 [Elusimicrobia bacterium RIFOXYA2_FULL_40_6]|nr:MAG: hypothetical protein A3J83_01640 [Elusimicrobia bacterium RIFOXYA2_FULL_40_6]